MSHSLRAIVCATLVILFSCGGEKPAGHGPAAAARTVKHYRIGLGPWIGFGPFYLARDKGWFRDAGVDIELITLTGLAERNSALKAGSIDGLAAPVDYFVLSAGNKVPTKIVMAIDESVGGDGIVAAKQIRTFADLRGKRVAFQRGLPSEFFLRSLLQQSGMKLKDLDAVDMETAQAGAAFISGRLDAAAVWEPWLTRAAEQGHGHVLASTKDHPNLIVDCLAFNPSVVEKAPDDVQKIVGALFRAIDFWKSNPAEANRVMAPYFQVSPDKYAAILSGAQFSDRARNGAYFGAGAHPGVIFAVAKNASELWQEAGITKAPVDPKSIITTQFVTGQ
jgi:NitT/TauT family transport system substrate-binding protein